VNVISPLVIHGGGSSLLANPVAFVLVAVATISTVGTMMGVAGASVGAAVGASVGAEVGASVGVGVEVGASVARVGIADHTMHTNSNPNILEDLIVEACLLVILRKIPRSTGFLPSRIFLLLRSSRDDTPDLTIMDCFINCGRSFLLFDACTKKVVFAILA